MSHEVPGCTSHRLSRVSWGRMWVRRAYVVLAQARGGVPVSRCSWQKQGAAGVELSRGGRKGGQDVSGQGNRAWLAVGIWECKPGPDLHPAPEFT